MKCFLLTGLLSLGTLFTYGQNNVDDLIKAPKVKDFIQLRIDTKNKKIFYQIDQSKSYKYDKTLKGPLTVTVGERDKEIALQIRFINPLKYKITCTDSTFLDSTYQNLSSLFQAVTGLLQTINGSAATKNAAIAGAAAFAGPATTEAMIAQTTSPSLVEWKYLSLLKDNAGHYPYANIDGFDKFAKAVFDLDSSFYNGTINDNTSTIGMVKKSLDIVSNQQTISKYNVERANFETFVTGGLKTRINNTSSLLISFKTILSNFNPDLAAASDAEKSYLHYTKWVMEKLIADVTIIDNQHKDILATLITLNTELEAFTNSSSEDEDNSVIIARIPTTAKEVHELRISISERKLAISNSEIKITTENTSLVSGKIITRAYRPIITEFSSGIFYTNVSLQKYGTYEEDGVIKVTNAGKDKYYYVVAAHVNLIYNTTGDVHPLFQIGVGSGKELPSLLSGVGLRFSGPQHLVIAGGCMWTWQKKLDKLSEGDVIDGTAALEKDLKYQLIGKPTLYLGLQYNF